MIVGTIRAHSANGVSIGLAVFAGLTSVTNRPTDTPADDATRSVPHLLYVRSNAMRPNNKCLK